MVNQTRSRDPVVIFGLSTEGYSVGKALSSQGFSTMIIDENLQMATDMQSPQISTYHNVASLLEDEPLMALIPMKEAISKASSIFFAPKIRKSGEEGKAELSSRLKDVAKHISTGAIFFFLPAVGIGESEANVALIEKVSGLKIMEDFHYAYAPFFPGETRPSVFGSSLQTFDKSKKSLLGLVGVNTSEVCSVAIAEQYYAKLVTQRLSHIAAELEAYKRINDPYERMKFKKLADYSDTYPDDFANGLHDLRVFATSLDSGEPLLHIISGVTRCLEDYVRYLVGTIRDVIKTNELKASKTRVILAWSIDRYSMRGEKMNMQENILHRLRDLVNDVMVIQAVQDRNEQSSKFAGQIFSENKGTVIISCSVNDQRSIDHMMPTANAKIDTIVVKGNLLCEVSD